MTRFIVMNDNDGSSGGDVLFIRDGLQPLAIILPLLWLVWKQLWLEAALVFAVTGIVAWVAHDYFPAAFPFLTGLISLAVGLLTALEGPAWLVASRERRGFGLKDIIIARSMREAEEIYASKRPAADLPARPAPHGFRPVSQASLIPLSGA